MIFRVAGALFAKERQRAADLVALLRNAAMRGHTLWVLDDPDDPAGLDCSPALGEWTARLGGRLEAEAGLLAGAARRLSAHAVTRGSVVVTVQDTSLPPAGHRTTGWIRLGLNDAIRLSSMPLLVLLENGLSDAAFLRRAMPPQWREMLESWEKAGVIRYENGGGVDEMARMVRHYGAAGRSPSPLGLGPDVWRASHVLVCDRDTGASGGPGPGARKLERACRDARMTGRLHILGRRNLESYLPRPALDAVVARKTGARDREQMAAELDRHFALEAELRHRTSLPTLGRSAWFKNAFLDERIPWEDRWFREDGVWPEMAALAETIASFA